MIFDFDGTVANTSEHVIPLLDELADEFGYRRAGPEEQSDLSHLATREVAERLGLAWDKLPLLAARVRELMTSRMGRVQPCAGMPAALAALRARGVGVGMLTSNKRENVEAFLAHQPSLQFDFISAGSGFFDKHTRLHQLLTRHGLTLGETCYVGDEVRDVEAARELGMCMVAVGWGYTAPQLLAASAPDHLLNDPTQLLALI